MNYLKAKYSKVGYRDAMKKPLLLPDVAQEKIVNLGSLDWVGMNDIHLPIEVLVEGRSTQIMGRVRVEVSLDEPTSRGIHMSRLFLLIQKSLTQQPIDLPFLQKLTSHLLESHKELSLNSRIEIKFQIPVRRSALKSDHWAWRSYPLIFKIENKKGKIRSFVSAHVLYSSTCPASAALARQLVVEEIKKEFKDQSQVKLDKICDWLNAGDGAIATPHAQRSRARVKVEVLEGINFNAVDLINLIEDSLQTPVQGAVKRIDEQEFARRNGKNLMFCEDAARRVARALDQMDQILGYRAQFEHFESLHSHNAVSSVSRRK